MDILNPLSFSLSHSLLNPRVLAWYWGRSHAVWLRCDQGPGCGCCHCHRAHREALNCPQTAHHMPGGTQCCCRTCWQRLWIGWPGQRWWSCLAFTWPGGWRCFISDSDSNYSIFGSDFLCICSTFLYVQILDNLCVILDLLNMACWNSFCQIWFRFRFMFRNSYIKKV